MERLKAQHYERAHLIQRITDVDKECNVLTATITAIKGELADVHEVERERGNIVEMLEQIEEKCRQKEKSIETLNAEIKFITETKDLIMEKMTNITNL